MGSTSNVNAAVADFDASQPFSTLPKNRSLVRLPIAIGIFKNQDSIAVAHIKVPF